MKNSFFLVMLLLQTSLLWSQATLKGKITGSDGTPLVGATVHLKNTTVGAVADAEGAISLDLPPGDHVLVVSYAGYGTREVTVRAGMHDVEITLEEGVTLRETVVTALGIARTEKSLGYAVAQVDGEALTKVRDQNIVNQLGGRAAGVTVIGSSGGNIGGSARITIRGMRSLIGNNQPLFVVDGVPMDNSNFSSNKYQPTGHPGDVAYETQRDYGNAIQDLNPDDIADIDILKGQAATALYGSRGANGVIMVTSKRGSRIKKGIGVSVNSSLTFDRVAVFPTFQNRYGGGVDLLPRGYTDNSGYYKTPYVELGPGGDTVGVFSSFDLVPIYAVDESAGVRFATSTDQHFQHLAGLTVDDQGTAQYVFYNGFGQNQPNLYFRDWNSWDAWDTEHFGKSRLWEAGDDPIKFFETGITSSQNIAFEGGGDRSTFRLSYTRFDQKGIYPNSHLERNTLSFNGSLDLNSRLQAFVAANYVNASTLGRTGVTYDFRGGFNPAQNFSQWWHTELRFADLKRFENPDGTMRTWNRQSADNPRPQYWDNPYWQRYKNYENDGRDRVYGNAGLKYQLAPWLTLTGRVLTDFYSEYREERIAVGSLLQGTYTQDLYNVAETNTDLILRAEKNFGEKLSTSAFIGGNRLWHKLERQWGATIGGLNVPDIYRLQNSVERPFIQNTTAKKQIESVFAGVSTGWAGTLYLDLTGRQDWSSTLPDNANGYFYPSASLSYVFSENIRIPGMSFGKIRLGWAKTGNDTDPYNLYTTYIPNPNFGSLANFTVPNTLNKIDLKPENTSSVEAGADLRFFHDRLGLDVSVYEQKTTDQIIPLPTSAASGFELQFINAGEMSNRGIEISLHAVAVRVGKFSWETTFNFGKNRNKLVSLLPDDPSLNTLLLYQPWMQFVARVGQPYGTILGPDFLYDKSGNKLVNPNTGFYLQSTEVVPIGNITPDFTGGMSNSFVWKNLTLDVLIDFRKGGDIFSNTNFLGRYSGLLASSAVGDERENGVVNPGSVAVLDNEGNPVPDGEGAWKSTGLPNTISAPFNDNRGAYPFRQDVYDGSFVKLREVSIGYSFPDAWLRRLGLAATRVSLVGRNLAILHKNIPNIDPDLAISASNFQGFEGGAVPSTRSLGVNLNFRF